MDLRGSLLQWRRPLALGLGAAALSLSGWTFAGPAAEPSAAGSDDPDVLRQQIEVGMGELGKEEDRAQDAKDFARTACVVDKRERGEEILELATDELLIIRDPSSGEQARGFALEKLSAAAERMDLLVDEARTCGLSAKRVGDDGDKARTDETKEPTTPMEDPSQGMGVDPVPPAIDGSWPPVASGSM
jgi:hypothetical protein